MANCLLLFGRNHQNLRICLPQLRRGIFILLLLLAGTGVMPAQQVLFDFENAPLQSPLPVTLTVSGITAQFSGTGQSYSIQNANTLGFVPQGFAGRCIYPSSVFLADLLIRFDQPLTDFSILYACQELACDDAATMRVTAYLNGNMVGTNTKTAAFPGTWPSDTLACSFPQGFDSVVVHYDSPPPLCQDYGVIFMADNMKVIPQNGSAVSDPKPRIGVQVVPNPVRGAGMLRIDLVQPEDLHIALHDLNGRQVQVVWDGWLMEGTSLPLNVGSLPVGLYFLQITGADDFQAQRIWVMH